MVSKFPGVVFATPSQIISWMKTPRPLSELNEMVEFVCPPVPQGLSIGAIVGITAGAAFGLAGIGVCVKLCFNWYHGKLSWLMNTVTNT